VRKPQKRTQPLLGPEGRPAKRQPSPEGLGINERMIASAVGAAPFDFCCDSEGTAERCLCRWL